MKVNDVLVWTAGAVLAVGLSASSFDADQSKNCDSVAIHNRDKTGTSASPETTNGSRTREISMSASRQDTVAEGMGLEPTTGFPAPEFQSGC
jgi:hypothetical protein